MTNHLSRLASRDAEAKSVILERIRQAQVLGEVDTSGYEVQREYRTTSSASHEELRNLLRQRLLDYKATVVECSSSDLANTVVDLLQNAQASSVCYAPGLGADLFSDFPGKALPDDVSSDPRDLDGVDAVVTGSHAAAAQTGTICLESGELCGRRALSLIPDHHICIVTMKDVVYGIPELVARMDRRRPNTWISGPSATSDIELVRVEGVHGPRNLEVIIVD